MRVDGLTLYLFPGCAYCGRVRHALRHLGLEVDTADIVQDSEARAELLVATGRTTVPVLRVRTEAGADRWIAESIDIVRFLYAQHGAGVKPPWWVWVTPAHVVLFLALVVFALAQLLR